MSTLLLNANKNMRSVIILSFKSTAAKLINISLLVSQFNDLRNLMCNILLFLESTVQKNTQASTSTAAAASLMLQLGGFESYCAAA